jgi:hypothetical protein
LCLDEDKEKVKSEETFSVLNTTIAALENSINKEE